MYFIFLFAQNGFTERSFDRHEAVPVIQVLHERRESGKSYLHSISVRLLASSIGCSLLLLLYIPGLKCNETIVGKDVFLFHEHSETNKYLYETIVSLVPKHGHEAAHSKG